MVLLVLICRLLIIDICLQLTNAVNFYITLGISHLLLSSSLQLRHYALLCLLSKAIHPHCLLVNYPQDRLI